MIEARLSSYLGPSFSSTRGPCSCHSCLVIHMFSLSAILNAEACSQYSRHVSQAFEVEKTYNVRQHGASEEDHVPSPRGILNADFEFLNVNLSIVHPEPSQRGTC